MRDGQIMQMQAVGAQRDALILGQFQFLQTRQQAMERVLQVSSLMDRLRWLWDPSLLKEVVDAVQIELLKREKAELEAAMKKKKIEVVGGLAHA